MLDFDASAADHATEIRVVPEQQGQVTGGYDLVIAGHACSRGLIAVTGDLGEFSRVHRLRYEDGLARATPAP